MINRGVSQKGEVGKKEIVPCIGEALVYYKSPNDYRYLIDYILKKYPKKFDFEHLAWGMGCSKSMLYEALLGRDLSKRNKKVIDKFWSPWRLIRIKRAFKLTWVEIGMCLEHQYPREVREKLMQACGIRPKHRGTSPFKNKKRVRYRVISKAEKFKLEEIAMKEAIKTEFVDSLLGAKQTAKERASERRETISQLSKKQRAKLVELGRKNPQSYDKYEWFEYL